MNREILLKNRHIKHIGKTAVFYVPAEKLNEKIRLKIHDFLVDNYNAYTHEVSEIKGYWSDKNELIKDEHERYEVSFSGDENLKNFIFFISEICNEAKEESIYLKIGEESYLVNKS
jgi:hypothetical protein